MPDDYYVSQYSGEEIDERLTAAHNAVRYDAAQSLTDAQKQQARGNIGAQNGTFVQTTFDTKGWYRIATGSRRSGCILTVQNSYNTGGPSSLKLLVTLNEDSSSLKCIEYTNYIVSAITNVRIVSNALNQYCIDVYYNVNGLNTVAIDFISTGLEEAKGQVPVYIGADDTLPSGENLMATMEYLNPPLALGVEYRTTERYAGKPVYAKTIDCGTVPLNTQKIVSMGVSGRLNKIRCNAWANSNADAFTIPRKLSGTEVTATAASSANNIYISSNTDTLANYTIYATVYYTKATDKEGTT